MFTHPPVTVHLADIEDLDAVMPLDAFAANPAALRLYRGLGDRDAGGVTFRTGPFRCFEKALQG